MTIEEYKEKKYNIIVSASYNRIDSLESCTSDKCKECMGSCCFLYPCTLSPNEFIDINDIDYMKSILDLGILSISPFETNKKFYIIRMRGIYDGKTITTDFVDTPNSCIMHTTKGCLLDTLIRPTDGLLLIPRPEYGFPLCENLYGDFKIISDWSKYQDSLKRLIDIYKDKEITIPNANSELVKTYKSKILGNKETK